MNNANLHIVIGLGITGLSCIRFLLGQQIPVMVLDTRDEPPHLNQFRQTYPTIPVYLGKNWPQEIVNNAKTLVVSPGVSIASPPIEQARRHGVEIIGDVELFARKCQTPLIAITGTNGKSTVTALLGEMAKACGKKVAVIGNIGEPVLALFEDNATTYDLIVMELSSFQLETTYSLSPIAATVLNITPDHMDRYEQFADYVQAKHRIFSKAKHIIINKQDPLSDSFAISASAKKWFFTTRAPIGDEFGLRSMNGEIWLAQGQKCLLNVKALKIVGIHNVTNALSALALGQAAGLPLEGMLSALKSFAGLSHRCQLVAQSRGIRWINDSKGTNIGACQAALEGIGQSCGKIILLLGGDGKGADFTDLIPLISKYCRAIISMGKDGMAILETMKNLIPGHFASTMQEAITLAAKYAVCGDVVLLSPACSSLDQYQNFSHRGDIFMREVATYLDLSE